MLLTACCDAAMLWLWTERQTVISFLLRLWTNCDQLQLFSTFCFFPCSLMLPFGSEPSEKAPKGLSFLSLSNAHKLPRQKPGPSRAFGAESAERLDVDWRNPAPTGSAKLGGASKRSLLPFRDECEEEPRLKHTQENHCWQAFSRRAWVSMSMQQWWWWW